jgi:asparagine synthase (glutamine-hydrolysing)
VTAIAGYWRFAGLGDVSDLCGSMLSGQAIHGRIMRKPRCAPGFAMGQTLFPLLPEDGNGQSVVEGSGGQFYLTADLRIDNREDIARTIGANLGGLSDLEILARLIAHCGIERALDRLVGDFAFALWDNARNKLILARDFLGQRPLHYILAADHVAFASMPKGLHALPGVERSPDRERLVDFLALLPESRDHSFYVGIAKVPAGHYVEIDSSGARVVEYWKPNLDPLILPDSRAYEEALRAYFDEAVGARLSGSEGRIGTHLSSGLDSSAVTASAAIQLVASGGRITAFTAVPAEGVDVHVRSEDIGDEGPFAAEVARLYPNIDHVRVCATGRSPFDNLNSHFELFDRPPLNPLNHTWIDAINDEAKARGLHVMLIGQKGNMSASYNGLTRLPGLLREGKLLRWWRLSGQIRREGMRSRSVLARSLAPFLPRAAWRFYVGALRRSLNVSDYSLIDPKILNREGVEARARQAEHDLLHQPWSDGQRMRIWALRLVDMGNYNKGMLGGWGVDHRDPTADRRLVEFSLRVPEEYFIADGVPRSLIRRAFKGRLPDSVVNNRKLGVQAADWHHGLVRSKAQMQAEVERIAALDETRQLSDVERLNRLMSNWPEDWNGARTFLSYGVAAPRAVSAMNFIRYAAGLN